MKKDKIQNSEWRDLVTVLPYKKILKTIEYRYGKRERKYLEDYMVGQTMELLEQQAGIFVIDLMRFMRYRRLKLTGKRMPLDD